MRPAWQRAGVALVWLSLSAAVGAAPPEPPAEGDERQGQHPACPDGKIFNVDFFENFCWDCLLPIRFMGGAVEITTDLYGGGDNDGFDGESDDASDETICQCHSYVAQTQVPGLLMGMWVPHQFHEAVRMPYCSMVYGGNVLYGHEDTLSSVEPSSDEAAPAPENERRIRAWGTHANVAGSETRGGFYNVHTYTVPILRQLGFGSTMCDTAASTFALAGLSEWFAEWGDDELATVLFPEVGLFSKPAPALACAADAVITWARGQPLNSLFWCSGTWGHLYPTTGAVANPYSPVQDANHAVMKNLALQHRVLMQEKSAGSTAYCHNHPWPFLVKNQYKVAQIYPVAERHSGRFLGTPSLIKGGEKSILGVGEDRVLSVFRWDDCCSRLP